MEPLSIQIELIGLKREIKFNSILTSAFFTEAMEEKSIHCDTFIIVLWYYGAIELCHIGRIMRKRVFDIRGQRRPRSACASAQSDQGLRCR